MSLPRASPPGAGLDGQAVRRLTEKLGEFDCHSIMVVKKQQVVAEGWWAPYNKDYRHVLFSLTKSFTSTAIGFAVQEGLLSVNDPVLKFFPGVLPCEPCSNMAKMTVRDLLTMSTGHTNVPVSWSSPGFFKDERPSDEDHVYKFLTSYVDKEPGSLFLYNTPATFMCGAILKSLTGQHVFDYLKPRLLDPLGITDYHCEVNKDGHTPAGFGGHMRTEDIAKFGLFYLNRGSWNGKQLLSASWIDEATSKQADNSNHPSGSKDWSIGYGYQFWRSSPPGVYRGDGMYGQFCIVMPEQEAVVAITSGTRNIGAIMGAVWDILVPELSKDSAATESAPDVVEHLKNLQIPLPQGKPHTEPSPYSGRVYAMATNLLRLTKISVTDNVEDAKVTFWRGEETCTASVGYGKWVESTTGEDRDGYASIFSSIGCAGAWEDNKFHLKIVYTAAPYNDNFVMSFEDKTVTIDYTRHPSVDDPRTYRLMGRET